MKGILAASVAILSISSGAMAQYEQQTDGSLRARTTVHDGYVEDRFGSGQEGFQIAPASPIAPHGVDDGDAPSRDDARIERHQLRTPPPARFVLNSRHVRKGDVLIDPAHHLLYLGVDDARVRVFPVAVGKRGASWHGVAKVGFKMVNPTWRPTAHMQRIKHVRSVVAPGPSNPLGVRALYLFKDGRDTLYRIHGTNQPSSIGKSVSHGCIRMRNADVVQLYAAVPVGATVTVL